MKKYDFVRKHTAFTIAEMMIVLLIVSIVLAVMAPLMTTKMRNDAVSSGQSPWAFLSGDNSASAYLRFPGDNQVAMIGQTTKGANDNAKLIINAPENGTHMQFKNGDTIRGRLYMDANKILLGNASTVGVANTTLGIGALVKNEEKGNHNTAIGYYALNNNTKELPNDDGIYANQGNTAVGAYASRYNTTGKSNTAVGYGALQNNTTSSYNTGIGPGTLKRNTVGYNTAVGYGSGSRSNGGFNTAIGVDSFAVMPSGKTGNTDIAIKTIGNVAMGYHSLLYLDNGVYNTSLGTNSLFSIYTGSHNTAIGFYALGATRNGSTDNIAIGRYALMAGTFEEVKDEDGNVIKTIIKDSTRKNNLTNNIAIGSQANKDASDGLTNSIAIGTNARANANYAVAIGANAGTPETVEGSATTTENYAIAIGYNAKVKANYAVAIGANAVSDTEHKIVIGTSDDTVSIPGKLQVYGNILDKNGNPLSYTTGGTVFQSDRRLKYVGSENKSGLDKIRQLKVFNYTFKKDKEQTPRVGVIAQDLQKVFPNAVKKGSDGFLTIRLEDMFYAVINAIKELDARLTKFNEILRSAQNDIKVLKEDNARLKKENAELKARLDRLEAKLK